MSFECLYEYSLLMFLRDRINSDFFGDRQTEVKNLRFERNVKRVSHRDSARR